MPRLALACAALVALAACAGAPRGPDCPEAIAWANGPARWLLLPDERSAFAQIRSCEGFRSFRRQFWERRDPTPEQPENPALATYLERVHMADRLYSAGTRPGSLTARGRALILLGPPSEQRAARGHARMPGDGPAPAGRRSADEMVESWGYRADDLEEALREALAAVTPAEIWLLRFVLRRGEAVLVEGEDLLPAAARAWARY